MGKTGDAIKAVAAAAIVVAAVKDPFDDCRNVDATDCPSLAPGQHHVHGSESAATPEPTAEAVGGVGPARDLSGATISVIEA